MLDTACIKCGSHDTMAAEAVWLSESQAGSGFAASDVYERNNGHVGSVTRVGSVNTEEAFSSSSLLAETCAPPDEPSNPLGWAGALVGVIIVTLWSLFEQKMLSLYAAGLGIWFIIKVWQGYKKKLADHSNLYDEWKRTWICRRCSQMFVFSKTDP